MRKVVEFLLKKYVHLNYVKVGYTIRICEKDSSTGELLYRLHDNRKLYMSVRSAKSAIIQICRSELMAIEAYQFVIIPIYLQDIEEQDDSIVLTKNQIMAISGKINYDEKEYEARKTWKEIKKSISNNEMDELIKTVKHSIKTTK